MKKSSPEIVALRRDIEEALERRMQTPADFDWLAAFVVGQPLYADKLKPAASGNDGAPAMTNGEPVQYIASKRNGLLTARVL